MKTITKEELLKIVSDFANENDFVELDDINISDLINDKEILLYETDSLENPKEHYDYDSHFKCCLIYSPVELSMTEVEKILQFFPSDSYSFAIKISSPFKVQFFVNS